MTPFTVTKFRNDLRKVDPELQLARFQNVKVNGETLGCSGWVVNPRNGRIVYVNTDHNHGTQYDNACYRIAVSTTDYVGGYNRFSNYRELAKNVAALLKSEDKR